MITKIEQDIHGRSTIAGYIFSRLKGNAARSALPWMEHHINVGDNASLWTTLDQIYNDPMHADCAWRKLLEICQGKNEPENVQCGILVSASQRGQAGAHNGHKDTLLDGSAIQPMGPHGYR
jgi:hypothetical protein